MAKGSVQELKNVDLNLIRTLVVLIEECSTTRAARRLLLSQPAVSGALARLRLVFGDELLVRSGRGLEPTARALELLDAVRPHLDGLVAAVAAASPFDPAQDKRTFRLGCTDAVALAALPQLTKALARDAPACNLIVRVGDYRQLPEMLATAEISTALGYLREDPSATARVRVLRRSPWVVIRDPATNPIADLQDFCGRGHALVTPLGDLSGFVDEQLAEQGFSRRVVIGVTSFALLLGVIPKSDLISTVPDFVAERLAALGDLVIEPCPVIIPPVTNTLAWRAAADDDDAERWFRGQVASAFAAASPT